jgi:hypothetical protein
MATKTTTKNNSLKPCECSKWEFGQFEPNTDTDYNTQCTEQTKRSFAMGHDAKLVGFLVRAELAGDEIRVNNGGVVHSFQGAVHAAASVSEALAAKAQAQLDAARARIARKAAREAAKTARKSAKQAMDTLVDRQAAHEVAEAKKAQPTHRHATIKVGRWTYRAAIEVATGDLIYTNKKGEDVALQAGQYTEVN